MHYSTPEMEAGKDISETTIYGAPCHVIPPFTHRELRQNYLGCQNLPTALWVAKFFSTTQQNAALSSNAEFNTEAPPSLFHNSNKGSGL